ncbi:MAG: DUF3047 domain-containing protein [Deltaproteobacteria bacterium]|nr:DUF3047 domain-containing protein [Deltaproteobacteria bacterium]
MNKYSKLPGNNILFVSIIICVVVFSGSLLCANGDVSFFVGFKSGEMTKGAPLGWELQESKGTSNLKLEQTETGYALHMKSDSKSSFGILKNIAIKKGEYPLLSWKWKVEKLPVGGDVRKAETDDQALQIYVAFEATGWPAKLKTPTIGYIWDNECPKGTTVTSPQPMAGKVRYIVLRDKTDKRGEWYTEKRNIFEDYKKLFSDIDEGKQMDVTGISFYINSQHTQSEAESYISDIYFSKN